MLSPSDSSFITEIIHASAFSSTFSHKHIEASSGATTNLCLGGKKKEENTNGLVKGTVSLLH